MSSTVVFWFAFELAICHVPPVWLISVYVLEPAAAGGVSCPRGESM